MKKIIMLIFVLSAISLNAKEIIHYKMDGNANNAISDKYNGVYHGNIENIENRYGDKNSALKFNGAAIIVDEFKNYEFGNELSISLWYKRFGKGAYEGFITNGSSYYKSGTFEIRKGRESSGSFVFARVLGDFGHVAVSHRNLVGINTWHHIVMTTNSNKLNFYLDGVLVSSVAKDDGKLTVSHAPLLIGSNRTRYGKSFNGALDDIKIFNHSLSESEVESLYTNNGLGYSVEITNTNNITSVNSPKIIPSKVLIKNKTDENIEAITWSALTLPNGHTIYKNTIKKYELPANGEININIRPKIYSWYPKGNYKFKYYLADRNVEGGNIIYDSFNFIKE